MYQTLWTPAIGETLNAVGPINPHNSYAVAVVRGSGRERDGTIVGHVPRNVSRVIFYFLSKDWNVGYCEVTGNRTNRGAGLGLEIPCVYKFHGRQSYVNRLNTLLSYPYFV